MDLKRPLSVITTSLDGDILAVLAAGEVKLTGRELGRRIGASQEGVRRALDRLVRQGIVLHERAGKAGLHTLNRQHLAAVWIERLAGLRLELNARLREQVESWSAKAHAVILFGSFARGDADESSDIDLLVIRPDAIDPDDSRWRRQLRELEAGASAMTGNSADINEYSVSEALEAVLREPNGVVSAARAEGTLLSGKSALTGGARRRRAK